MIITSKVRMDLQQPGIMARVNVVQDDRYSRNLEISLYSGGVSWTVPAGAAALIRYCKADGKGGEYDTLPDGTAAWSAVENVLTIALAPQVLTAPGFVDLSVSLVLAEKQISTFVIGLNVQPVASAKIAESEGYTNVTRFLPAPAAAEVGKYIRVSAVDDDGHVTEVEAVSVSGAAGGEGGLSPTAAALLITILRNGVYSSDQSGNITALEASLASGGSDDSGGGSGSDSGDSGNTGGGDSGDSGSETVTHTITNNLTKVTTSNSASTVEFGGSYSATLTAVDGYVLDAVTVTMGGVDITSTACLDGVINIATVSGDLVITATAVGEPVEIPALGNYYYGISPVYSDNGDTELGINLKCFWAYDEVFTEDTKVTITIETTGSVALPIAAACSNDDSFANSTAYNFYYGEYLRNNATVNVGTYVYTYTAKAGYRLIVGTSGQNISIKTPTVTM